MKRITISEVAKLANVSKTTVSRVINNKPDISPETRKKVLEVMDEYSFKPNAYATAVSNRKTKTIGLITPQGTGNIYTNPFYSRVLHGIATEITEQGYYLMFSYIENDDYIDVFERHMVDGFVLLSPGVEDKKIVDKLKAINAPFISTTVLPGLDDHSYIDIDNYHAASIAVKHLLALGHKNIMIINSFSTLLSNKHRLKGYQDALKEKGIAPKEELIFEGEPIFETGFGIVMSQPELPTAIFACSDMIALGAIEAIKKRGKQVPTDISVVGFDDIHLAGNFGLTTIRQPILEKGKIAAKMLINKIEGKEIEVSKLEVQLIDRRTTKAVREEH
ncbi:LacI family DNA-binding transcriptional regulator [Neobacillus niacini]|uniref:LacI family DNA-binding transcriptional regulator n=1 Tax=Neobacillus niacini TaxID=86668 RepID=UPI002FFF1892